MNYPQIASHIVDWLSNYCKQANLNGFIVGISGGIDSASTAILCAKTGLNVTVLNMPIRQTNAEYARAIEQTKDLEKRFPNVKSMKIDLTPSFESIEQTFPAEITANHLAMANSRSRLRMLTLYAIGQANGLLVAGTGNKIEDFGIGFFTKYGDGGVDISPLADLTKTDVFQLAKELKVVDSIQQAKPTDGLWEDGRSDEDQIGASYPELEWAMEFEGDESTLSPRQQEVLVIYRRLHRINLHKIEPIPVCIIPDNLK
ncbi:MAG: NAD(+) synthase [Crocinitomicaceae bacterium]|nr:NAD(+) synthase [Crocinitomicaceae bacterium]